MKVIFPLLFIFGASIFQILKGQEISGTYATLADGSEFVYQLLPESVNYEGIILLAHGCHHR